jgi:hypothetical protein
MRTTDPDLWKCKRCGLPMSRCKCRGVAARVFVFGVALALLATPIQAQCDCEIVPEPIIGIPCNSDAEYLCYDYQIYLPILEVW